jgi:hypothetical protein
LFYGSFMYLQARLAGRFPVEVVPGVTSVAAAAAVARLPLGARDGRIAVLPATLPDETLAEGLRAHETVALLKLGRHFPRVRALVGALGLTGRATYVERATLGAERVMPLAKAPAEAPYFSLLLIAKDTGPMALTPVVVALTASPVAARLGRGAGRAPPCPRGGGPMERCCSRTRRSICGRCSRRGCRSSASARRAS